MNQYPLLKEKEHTEDYFGHLLQDPYAWIRDGKQEEVLRWVAEENAYTDAWFNEEEVAAKAAELKRGKLPPLPVNIHRRGSGLTATVMDDGTYCVVAMDENMENQQVLIDRGMMDRTMPYELSASPVNERMLCLTCARDGDARLTVLFIDAEEKKVLQEFHDIFFCSWSNTRPAAYIAEVLSEVGTQASYIRILCWNYEENTVTELMKDEKGSIIGEILTASDNRHVIFCLWEDYCHYRYYAYDEQTGGLEAINADRGLKMTYIDTLKNRHWFISKEKEPMGELICVAAGETVENAETVRPAGRDVLSKGFCLKGKIHLLSMRDISSRMTAFDPDSGTETVCPLPSDMGTADYAGRAGGTVYLKFESFVHAPMLLAFDGEKIEIVLRTSDREYPDVLVEQHFAPSKADGREIPYFIVRRKDCQPDGTNPACMYAYGGYNIPMTPWHTDMVTGLNIPQWAEQGGVYILAGLRGGSEYGDRWHEEGMLMKKKNCYGDFIGVVEQVMAHGWTSPEKLAIDGCSNGGLLMSALVTMRPELFGCVIDSVPHTDMIAFADDDRGSMYITEYGNPKESEEIFRYLLSYSPYHNIRKEKYPPIYIQTGECDNNVPPYHGKKFAARLQQMNQSDNPVLLRVLAEGSHDRGVGDIYWKTIAEMQIFVEKALKLK